MRFGVIMAGGSGERFWPLSRRKKPKQILKLMDDTTLLDITVKRLEPLIPNENIYVATSEKLKESILQHTNCVSENNFICEPVGRNTAPCLGLAAVYLRKKFGDVTMAVMTADHIIENLDVFNETINVACTYAENESCIVIFGISPTRPDVGYGYIEADNGAVENPELEIYKVRQFREKPNFKLATEFVNNGNFYWNSGMFVWRISTILDAFSQHLPSIYEGLLEIEKAIDTPEEKEVLEKIFPKFPKISIDYGIMEKADNVYVIKSKFVWDDIGSWNSLERIRSKDDNHNIVYGKCVTLNTKNSIVFNESESGKIVGTLGLKNIIVVATDDAVLVCHKDKSQEIKKIISSLKDNNLEEFL